MSGNVRSRILETAGKLFYAEGTRSVGIDRVIDEAPVAKATLYRHFPSKQLLVETYLQERHTRLLGTLKQTIAQIDGDAAFKILHIFDGLATKADLPEFRGCAFLIAVAENEHQPSIVAIAREHKAALQGVFHQLAAQISSDPGGLSEQLALCYEGALATISVSRNSSGAITAKRIAEQLIALHRPPQVLPEIAVEAAQ